MRVEKRTVPTPSYGTMRSHGGGFGDGSQRVPLLKTRRTSDNGQFLLIDNATLLIYSSMYGDRHNDTLNRQERSTHAETKSKAGADANLLHEFRAIAAILGDREGIRGA